MAAPLAQGVAALASPAQLLTAQSQALVRQATSLGSVVTNGNSNVVNQVRNGGITGPATDFRVRLAPLNPAEVYGSSPLLAILKETDGMMFPYTPSIQFNQSVEYNSTDVPHSIADLLSYKYTPSVELQITGKFTVQNGREARYAMACIHFLRVASKMYFGEKSSPAGMPPPMLVLDGYGAYMFNRLRCVLRSHNWNLDEQQEMVSFVVNGQTCRLPPLFSISVTVKVQQTPAKLRTEFNINDFRSGKLMERGGWI